LADHDRGGALVLLGWRGRSGRGGRRRGLNDSGRRRRWGEGERFESGR
jgi:hypothetical protein